VSSLHAGDCCDSLAGGGVKNFDSRPVGEIEKVRGRVGDEIVPAARAANLPAVDDLIGLLGEEQKRR
jgi:hypothetical protein